MSRSRRSLGYVRASRTRWGLSGPSSLRRCCSACRRARLAMLAAPRHPHASPIGPGPCIQSLTCFAVCGACALFKRHSAESGLAKQATPAQEIHNPEDFITACESSWRPELLLEDGASDFGGGIMPDSPAGAFLRRCRLAFASRPFEVRRPRPRRRRSRRRVRTHNRVMRTVCTASTLRRAYPRTPLHARARRVR